MVTMRVNYADGMSADLPVFAVGKVPGLAIVRDDNCHTTGDYGRPYGIIHVASTSYLKPCFAKLGKARAAMMRLAGLADWTQPPEELRKSDRAWEARAIIREEAQA